MIEYIKDGETIIAQIIRNAEWPENLHFYTTDVDCLQVATWRYPKGKHLKAHAHKFCERTIPRTNEFISVKKGRLQAYFYSENDVHIAERELQEGDMVLIYAGGHAYDILEENTEVLEVKNGPYPGIEKDKKVIEI